MIDIVLEFFQIIGVDAVPPTNMAELIPYLLIVFVGLMLAGMVFKTLVLISRLFTDRSWRV